ncbi:hypothetical protein [Streptomyces sp. NPDC006638]|uniref:hypothetical protein n=1 Tax=Streptomyces sp. NPDC006638 TaxID=3157183 RepID=UPI0033BA75B6
MGVGVDVGMETVGEYGEYGERGVTSSYQGGDGCLAVAVRIPVRIVVLLLVLPVRVVWDLLAAGARAVDRTVLRPLGRGLVRGLEWLGRALGVLGRVVVVLPLVRCYETLVVPLGTALRWVATAVFLPLGRAVDRLLVAAYRNVLTPLGKALVWPLVAVWRYVLVPVVRYGMVVPAVWVWRSALVPLGLGVVWLLGRLGHGLSFCARALWAAVVRLALVLVVAPGGWVVRRILVPVGREIGAAFSVAWRIAGYLSRALGRALAWVAWNAVGRPGRWTYRNVCTPVGHWVRDNVLAPAARASRAIGRVARETLESARETFRQTRRDAWRALVGATRGTSRMTEPREPIAHRARTLGSTTTVPGAVPAPEISLRKQG